MTDDITEYLETIRHELEKLKQNRFTGNIGFRVNFKDGGVCNMNIELAKSVKLDNPAAYSDRR